MREEARRKLNPWVRFMAGFFVGGLVVFGLALTGNKDIRVGRSPLLYRNICMSALGAIGKRIGVYAAEHHDSFPPDLGTLASEDFPPGIFLCPRLRGEPVVWPQEPNQLRAAGNREADYIYAPLSTEANAEMVTVYELPANHQQEIANALFADLHVGSLSASDGFLAGVQKTNDFLGARRGAKP